MTELCKTNIIFDFGGVLMMHDREGCLKAFRMLMCEEDMANVLGLGNDKPGTLRARFEVGELSAEEFLAQVLKHCKPGTTAEQVISAWNTIHAGISDSTWAQIRRLRERGCGIYLLSNTDAIHWQHTIALYGNQISELFDGVFLSFEMKACKPDARVFQAVHKQIAAEPGGTIFVDDTAANRLAAEQSVGWRTVARIENIVV